MHSIKPTGDKSVLIQFEQEISPQTNNRVMLLSAALNALNNDAIIENIPTYCSLSVVYEPKKCSYREMVAICESVMENMDTMVLPPPKVVEIPVLYGGEWGLDMDIVMSTNAITEEELIKIHSSTQYLIYMLGFSPGFPYLGGMDKRIATPRKQIPRQKIAAGSVGIAGEQTGMYPNDSPGGWQIIGITPLKLYDPLRQPPIYYSSGDYIQYSPINQSEFDQIKALDAENKYKWVISNYEGGRGDE